METTVDLDPSILIVPGIVLLVLVAWLLRLGQRISRLEDRLREPSSPPQPMDAALEEKIRRAVSTGGLILGVKEYREATGAGLKESKEAVEALVRRN